MYGNSRSTTRNGSSPTLVIPGVCADSRMHSRVLQSPLAARRAGIMLHYDDSARDDWALEWFKDPRCKNGYTWLVLDDGALVELADPAFRTPHAGPCLVPRANSVFYGISAATNGLVVATPDQMSRIIRLCVTLFKYHGWRGAEAFDRILGHDQQAVWTPEYTKAAGIPEAKARLLWGTVGRKVDPTGVRPDGRKIIDVHAVQAEVALRLGFYPEGGNDNRCHPERSPRHPERSEGSGRSSNSRSFVAGAPQDDNGKGAEVFHVGA